MIAGAKHFTQIRTRGRRGRTKIPFLDHCREKATSELKSKAVIADLLAFYDELFLHHLEQAIPYYENPLYMMVVGIDNR